MYVERMMEFRVRGAVVADINSLRILRSIYCMRTTVFNCTWHLVPLVRSCSVFVDFVSAALCFVLLFLAFSTALSCSALLLVCSARFCSSLVMPCLSLLCCVFCFVFCFVLCLFFRPVCFFRFCKTGVRISSSTRVSRFSWGRLPLRSPGKT